MSETLSWDGLRLLETLSRFSCFEYDAHEYTPGLKELLDKGFADLTISDSAKTYYCISDAGVEYTEQIAK